MIRLKSQKRGWCTHYASKQARFKFMKLKNKTHKRSIFAGNRESATGRWQRSTVHLSEHLRWRFIQQNVGHYIMSKCTTSFWSIRIFCVSLATRTCFIWHNFLHLSEHWTSFQAFCRYVNCVDRRTSGLLDFDDALLLLLPDVLEVLGEGEPFLEERAGCHLLLTTVRLRTEE